MTDPQPVPDAYRCGDLTDEWEVLGYHGGWRDPSDFPRYTIRPARRKAPPLTPREGDTVTTSSGYEGQVVYTDGESAVIDSCSVLVVCALSDLTVTDRPPARPVRVWLTDEQVQDTAQDGDGSGWGESVDALVDACRALVDEG